MKPPRSILDPRFRYVPSGKTDVAATIRRARRELAESQAQTAKVVRTLKRDAK